METPVLVQSQGNLPESCHIPGRLNAIANKLSRHRQVIQTEWSLHPEVFAQICHRWHLPKVDLFVTRYNYKRSWFVSPPVPEVKAWEVYALSLSWENLDLYAFPPIPLLTNVVTKALGHQCQRMIIIAPSWLNMPWFWDLVELSSQIPICLPNWPDLLTQPFNSSLHRDLQTLNLHAWLLEPRLFGNRVSLTKWQRGIEAPQRRSTRFVYEAKWSVFVQWKVNQVDFQSPSVEQILEQIFCCTCFRTENCSLVPQMGTGRPLLIN